MQTHEFLEMYAKILSSYSSAAAKAGQRYGLNQTCFMILVFLKNNPQYDTARDLEEKRGIKKAMASVSIEKLCQGGYLTRRPDPEDRRIQHLELTERAEEAAGLGQQLQKDFQDRLFAAFTPEEREHYEVLSQKLLAALQELGEDMIP